MRRLIDFLKIRSNRKNLMFVGVSLFMLPVLFVVAKTTLSYLAQAENNEVRLSFEPSNVNLPPDKLIYLNVNSTDARVGFVRVSASFDKNKIQLTDEIDVNSMFTVISKTTLEDANASGSFTVVGVSYPRDSVAQIPSGSFVFANLSFRAVTTDTNDTASVVFNNSDSQIVSSEAQSLPVSSQPLTLNLNVTQTPEATTTAQPTADPTATPSPVPSASPTSSPTPSLAPTPTPTLSPTPQATDTPTAVPTATPVIIPTQNGLVGQYFNTQNLENPAVLTRVDSQVNFNWRYGSPDSQIEADTFSVRWGGFVLAPVSGNYTFYTESDDGVRLWVNDTLLIWDWSTHPAKTNKNTIYLEAGQYYQIRMEYFEAGGRSVAKLAWSYSGKRKSIIPNSNLFVSYNPVAQGPTPTPTLAPVPVVQGLVGSYHNGRDVNNLSFSRIDSQVDFDWVYSSPDIFRVGVDNFSVEWTGFVQAPTSGEYKIYTQSDDGVRLWFNNNLVVENWDDHALEEDFATVTMDVGDRYPIRLQFYENYNHATIKLLWEGPGVDKSAIPTEYLYTTGL